jgi:hypothetical protein
MRVPLRAASVPARPGNLLLRCALLYGCLAAAAAGFSQTVRGTVTDSLTGTPLAFANIVVQQRKTGTTTDIDGKFALVARPGETLLISHVGYRPARITVAGGQQELTVLLKPTVQQLGEVVIVAGENPAWRIIRNATAAKDNHRPGRLDAYAYKLYTKTIVTMDGSAALADSLRQKRLTTKLTADEALTVEADSVRQRQHVMVSESVTENFFRQPDRRSTRLLDYKTSGFESPLMASMLNNTQPLNFYDDWITFIGKSHRSPLTKGSERVYDFSLVDTTFYEGDSVFVITFEPLGSSGQNRLRGQISISRIGWAIKNVMAISADPYAKLDFRIQQNYQRVDGIWFPEQLNTNLYLKEAKIGQFYLVADVRSYLREVRINPTLPKNVFDDVEVSLTPPRDTTQLAQYRSEKYDSLESRTFEFLDSINRAMSVLRIFENLFETIFRGTITTGKIDWDINRFLGFNRFEGLRPGASWRTNPRFSDWLSVGGYAAYGLRDNLWKYGGDVTARLSRLPRISLQMAYAHDVAEPGMHNFFEEYPALANFSLRRVFATRMDLLEQFRTRVSWKPAASWRVRAGLNQTHFQPQFAYAFFDGIQTQSDFRITEVVSEVSYVKNLREMTYGGVRRVVSLGFNRLSLLVSQGLAGVWNGGYRFTRYEFFYTSRWRTRGLGTATASLMAGYLHGIAPVQRQFFAPGGRELGIWTQTMFQTMGIYEFLTDRYAAAFWRHNLGHLYQSRRSKPEVILWNAAGVGQLGRPENAAHLAIEANDFASGYFESGLGADNILRFNYADVAYIGVGGGVFYRWGRHALPSPNENVALRLNMTFSF